MPGLAGKSLQRARSALAASHCALGNVRKPKPRQGKKTGPLVVKRSLPGAGATLPAGGTVELRFGPPKTRRK